MTTAQVLGKYWEELEAEGFNGAIIDQMVRDASREIIAAEGLTLAELEDDPDPDVPEVGIVSLRVVPDLSPVRALVDAV